ncbi:hypothetical protein CR513_02209, partial [Mucuna pruriens]
MLCEIIHVNCARPKGRCNLTEKLYACDATSVVNISTQINSISMLNGTNFKVWKEAIVILLSCIDLDLTLQVEKLIFTSDILQEVKIEKWKHSI